MQQQIQKKDKFVLAFQILCLKCTIGALNDAHQMRHVTYRFQYIWAFNDLCDCLTFRLVPPAGQKKSIFLGIPGNKHFLKGITLDKPWSIQAALNATRRHYAYMDSQSDIFCVLFLSLLRQKNAIYVHQHYNE